MPEFVSALFKFVPENDDELPLEIGERVEVLEKDQFHNDGWWTVSIIIPHYFSSWWSGGDGLRVVHCFRSRRIGARSPLTLCR